MRTHHLKISGLYLLLIAGGLWHALGVLQQVMRLLASPMLFVLALWLGWEYACLLGRTESSGEQVTKNSSATYRFVMWSIGVIAGSFGVELIGVRTGLIFGHYSYGTTLIPSVAGVPLAIGFAWLNMLLSSFGISRWLFRKKTNLHRLQMALLVALLMVLFDLLMEPAAVRLDYWRWQSAGIPLQNYIAWFVLSFLFAYSGLRLELFHEPTPWVAFHAYVAQLIYFVLVLWG